MEEKLRRLMKHEGINSTKLAEILGIQASGISHIMSGRNKPSYDFLVKLLQRFPQINPDWLLIDKGPMYRDEIKKGTTSATSEKSQPSGLSQHAPGQGGGVQASGSGGVSAGLFSGQPGGSEFNGDNVGRGGSGNFGERQNGVGAGNENGVARDTGGVEYTDGFASYRERDGAVATRTTGTETGTRRQEAETRPSYGSESGFGIGNVGSGERNNGTWAGAGTGFGPDNNDIIPTGRPTGNHVGNQVENLSGSQATTARDAYGKMPYNYGQANSPFPSPSPFARTASIERIVVFYKDKTFSEYQPE